MMETMHATVEELKAEMHASVAESRVEMHSETPTVIKKGYSPYIGENGTWFVYDTERKTFVDTGVKATGPEGPQGQPGPTIGTPSFAITEDMVTVTTDAAKRVAPWNSSYGMTLNKISARFPATVSGDVFLYFLGWGGAAWYNLTPAFTTIRRIYRYTPANGQLVATDIIAG